MTSSGRINDQFPAASDAALPIARHHAQVKPKFHLLRHVTSRHDTHDLTSVSRLSCVSRRACSNMAVDEEAVVLAYTSLFFCALDLHPSQNNFWKK